jgi:hypothetical protein
MTYEQFKEQMKRQKKKYKTWAAWAKEIDVSTAYISDVWKGRRDPGEKLLKAMGLERVVEYRAIRKESK